MSRFSLIGLLLAIQLLCAHGAIAAVTVEGQVVHPESERDLGGLPVKIIWQRSEESFDSREGTTTADGSFRFESLDWQPAFGVLVEYEGIAFPIQVVQFTDEQKDATKSVRLPIRETTADASKLQVLSLETLLDRRDGGFFEVVHTLWVRNPTDEIFLVKEPGQSLVELGLLPGAGDVNAVQFVSQQLAPADVAIDSGIARYKGPLFPGDQPVQLRYEVETGSPDLEAQLTFPSPIPQFALKVPHRRQAVYAKGLYPSKPNERFEDPRLQYFRAYDLTPESRIDVRIEEIPKVSDGKFAGAAGVALLMFGLLVFVGMPLASELRGDAVVGGADRPQSPGETLALALSDLEHDFEMGKISSEDRDRLQQELYRETVEEIALQRQSEARAETGARSGDASPKPAKTQFCTGCGDAVEAGDRFCRSCGSKL